MSFRHLSERPFSRLFFFKRCKVNVCRRVGKTFFHFFVWRRHFGHDSFIEGVHPSYSRLHPHYDVRKGWKSPPRHAEETMNSLDLRRKSKKLAKKMTKCLSGEKNALHLLRKIKRKRSLWHFKHLFTFTAFIFTLPKKQSGMLCVRPQRFEWNIWVPLLKKRRDF